MKQRDRNTVARLETDIVSGIRALASERTHGHTASPAVGKAIHDEAFNITARVIDCLRRNWTVTERARSQRRVPPK